MKVNSIGQFRQLLLEKGPNIAISWSEDFLHQAAQDKDEGIKQILIEIATKDIASDEDYQGFTLALAWLIPYKDLDLVPILIQFLRDKKKRCPSVIYGLVEFTEAGLIQPQDPQVVKSLIDILAQGDTEMLPLSMTALAKLKAPEALDMIAGYLEHPNARVRAAAVIHIGYFQLTKREDLVNRITQLLNDESAEVRLNAAFVLRKSIPERFSHLDLRTYC